MAALTKPNWHLHSSAKCHLCHQLIPHTQQEHYWAVSAKKSGTKVQVRSFTDEDRGKAYERKIISALTSDLATWFDGYANGKKKAELDYNDLRPPTGEPAVPMKLKYDHELWSDSSSQMTWQKWQNQWKQDSYTAAWFNSSNNYYVTTGSIT